MDTLYLSALAPVSRAESWPSNDSKSRTAGPVPMVSLPLLGPADAFVHSAMGKSRSATVVIAYLMQKLKVDPRAALSLLQESRGVCEPNPGFMLQLALFYDMGLPTELDNRPKYQRWLYQRELDLSRSVKQAPEADKIRFEDEYSVDGVKSGFDLKCRKCRYDRRRVCNRHETKLM